VFLAAAGQRVCLRLSLGRWHMAGCQEPATTSFRMLSWHASGLSPDITAPDCLPPPVPCPQVAVFDDAAALEDPQAGLLGVASVPCAALADNLPVEGSFLLLAPGSGAAVGAVQLSMSWASGWAPQVPHRPLPGE
jgi:hypothetical protein